MAAVEQRLERRSFMRRSGDERRREQRRIYWPERRKAERRERADRRQGESGSEPPGQEPGVPQSGRLVSDPDRMADRVRDWLGRLPGNRR